MIFSILSFILFLIFIVLGTFHFYWFFGGNWGVTAVIPTKKNTSINAQIPKIATLIVAFVLIFFGWVYLLKSGFVYVKNTNCFTPYVYWIIPFIFILRAIGEFNYVGFFKKIRNTEFAKADSKLFSPLCLFIGIVGILIQLFLMH